MSFRIEHDSLGEVRVPADALYGASRSFGPDVSEGRDRLIALHARGLTFLHPIRYEPVALTALLPATWAGWAPGV